MNKHILSAALLGFAMMGSTAVNAAVTTYINPTTNNGSFETVGAANTWPSWTVGGVMNNSGVTNAYQTNGVWSANFGSSGLGTISQTFAAAVVGETLSISFDVATDGLSGNQFGVTMNGSSLLGLQTLGNMFWTTFTYTFIATASNTLTFSIGDPNGFTQLDNVVVTGDGVVAATPIPAAMWLFGTGIAGLVGASKRKKAAAAVVA